MAQFSSYLLQCVDIGEGRDGSNGVVADINTAARGEPSEGVRLYRRIESAPAYYSAWFKLHEAHSVSDWWSIFLFHARDDSLSLDNDVSMWDVRIVDTPGGEMALQFFDHDVMQGTLAGRRGNIAPGAWFEIRAYLDYRPPNDTRLVVWLLPEPVRTAQIATVGFDEPSIVCRGAISSNEAPAASAREPMCMTCS